MAESSGQLMWMLGDDAPVNLPTDGVVEAHIVTPDAGESRLQVELRADAPALAETDSDGPLARVGARVRVGVMYGIVVHLLFDGRLSAVDANALTAVDVLADLALRHTASPADSLAAQIKRVLAAWPLAGKLDECVVPADAAGVSREPGESDGSWLERVTSTHGLVVTRRPGPLSLSNIVRVAPLAMERTSMPAITPADCLAEHRFSPAPGVRVAEVRLHPTTRLRGLVRGVFTLTGFGPDDGAWYAQQVAHHLTPQRVEQTVTLVRVSP